MSELVIDQEEAAVSVPPLTLGWRMQMSMSHSGRSIEQMAMTCGVGRSTVSRWLHDKGRRPRRGDLEVWARECRVPFGWLAPNPEDIDDFEQLTVASELPQLTLVHGEGHSLYPKSPLLTTVPTFNAPN